MNNTLSTNRPPKGITEKNRQLLTTLHRESRGPFNVTEAAELLSLSLSRSRRLLAYLAERGWLVRIRNGLYTTVPLDAKEPSQWREEPWIIAYKLFAPSFYIGGWSACEHWGLTEQIFRETLVMTTRKLRSNSMEVQGFPFHVKRVGEPRIFGTRSVWRAQTRVPVSDPTRTLVDVLDDPGIGGGIRHVTDILANYLEHEQRSDSLLIDYTNRLGNRSVFKRLGYLLEFLGVISPILVNACRSGMSSGTSSLDPSLPSKGPILRRWNLRLNATLVGEGVRS